AFYGAGPVSRRAGRLYVDRGKALGVLGLVAYECLRRRGSSSGLVLAKKAPSAGPARHRDSVTLDRPRPPSMRVGRGASENHGNTGSEEAQCFPFLCQYGRG